MNFDIALVQESTATNTTSVQWLLFAQQITQVVCIWKIKTATYRLILRMLLLLSMQSHRKRILKKKRKMKSIRISIQLCDQFNKQKNGLNLFWRAKQPFVFTQNIYSTREFRGNRKRKRCRERANKSGSKIDTLYIIPPATNAATHIALV